MLIGAILIQLVRVARLHPPQPRLKPRKFAVIDRHQEPNGEQRRPNAKVRNRHLVTAHELTSAAQKPLEELIGQVHVVDFLLRDVAELPKVHRHHDLVHLLEEVGAFEEQQLIDMRTLYEIAWIERRVGSELLHEVNADCVAGEGKCKQLRGFSEKF